MNLFSTFFLAACFTGEILAFSFTRSKCELQKRQLIRALLKQDNEVSSLYRLNSENEPERICAAGYSLIWDINFCMKVCALQTGDQCSRTSQSGVDLCDLEAGLECLSDDYRTDWNPTCQPLVTFDSLSSASSSSSWNYFNY